MRGVVGVLLVSGGLALAGPAHASAPARPDVGPPPMLPDLGPPPALPPPTGGGDLSAGTPPTSAPPAARPSGPPAGPPVMRPTARPVAPTPPPTARPVTPGPSTSPPTPPPTARPVTAPGPSTSPPTARPVASPGPAPSGPAVPAPPVLPSPTSGAMEVPPPPALPEPAPSGPSAAPPVASAPVGDPTLEAPRIEGPDPIAPEEPPAAPKKSKEEEAEEEARALRKTPKKWRHNGLILEPRVGVLGCTRQFCAGSGAHDARPGALLGGFVGGNLYGLLDLGLEAQWSAPRTGAVAGRNAVALYGLDPALVQQVITERTGVDLLAIDFSQLTVTSGTMRSVSAGPAMRIHFIRRGRGLAYVGAGIHYQLWRNRYETAGGPTRLDFHGFVAPLRVGGGAYVHPNIAVVGEFAYNYAFYMITGISHPDLSAVTPLTVIEGAALEAGSNLRKGLPHFWSFTVAVRFRLGM